MKSKITKLACILATTFTFQNTVLGSAQFKEEIVIKGHKVHSVQTIDYNNDGLQDLIYSANYSLNLALAPDFKPIEVAKHTKSKMASIHSMVMDVDGDGDLDFVASDQGTVWFENPSAQNPETKWKKTWTAKITLQVITAL